MACAKFAGPNDWQSVAEMSRNDRTLYSSLDTREITHSLLTPEAENPYHGPALTSDGAGRRHVTAPLSVDVNGPASDDRMGRPLVEDAPDGRHTRPDWDASGRAVAPAIHGKGPARRDAAPNRTRPTGGMGPVECRDERGDYGNRPGSWRARKSRKKRGP